MVAMTLTQRLSIKASEQRARLGELGALEELTPELRSELDTLSTAHTDTESQLRAAIAADGEATPAGDPTVDPEVRERLELRGRASFGRYLHAALTGAPITGPEAEFQSACGVPGIPIDLFEQDRPVEVRADAPSGVPATGAGATLAPIQPYVFAESIAPMLGIEMPSVGSGAYSEMTISTALTAAAKAKGVAQESTAAVLSATVAKPRSIRARLTMNLEDIAEIGVANFESALRQNAGAALSDALDNEIINGDGSAPSVDGLIHQQTDPTNPTALVLFDTFLKSFSDQVDGLWASRMKDVIDCGERRGVQARGDHVSWNRCERGPGAHVRGLRRDRDGRIFDKREDARDRRERRTRHRLPERPDGAPHGVSASVGLDRGGRHLLGRGQRATAFHDEHPGRLQGAGRAARRLRAGRVEGQLAGASDGPGRDFVSRVRGPDCR